MKFRREIILLIAGIVSAVLINMPLFHLRVLGIASSIVVSGYTILIITGFDSILITPVAGMLLITLNALILNYTPLRNSRALYALPAIIIPLIALIIRLRKKDTPEEDTQTRTARELARRSGRKQSERHEEDEVIRLGLSSRDLLIAGILSSSTPILISLTHLRHVRFLLALILIVSTSYLVASAFLTGLRERRRLKQVGLIALFVSILTPLACLLVPRGYGHIFLGVTGILAGLAAYIRRSRQRIKIIESLQQSEMDILEKYGLVEDEITIEIPEISDDDLYVGEPSAIKKKALKMRKIRGAPETGKIEGDDVEGELKKAFSGHEFPSEPEKTTSIGGFSDLAVLSILSILTIILLRGGIAEALFYLQVLFIPGYILISAIAPERVQLSIPERLFLAFSTSIIMTSVIALLMGGHVTFKPFLARTVAGLSLALTPAAFIRRWRRGELAYSADIRSIPSPRNLSRDGKISLFLSIILVALIAVTVYITLNPAPSERFTEFYILGPGGKAYGYPENLTAGANASVIVGVVNREYRNETYLMVVRLGGDILRNETIRLSDKEKWERKINFTVTETGENQKLEFLLYRLPDKRKPYRSLHLFINVR
ncbi:DUF1616 domain-containing protein [Methanothermobacter marburgensis]|uniref:DUF1616 domain-containing protein n=1 Tax=Methanothermobacter marburgensis (strain ATCC BAA-927 / DSM 2133 / JCM 14651 / NBRC 100331 / OCM 82 / Marburg) TaxID=79929 RepID=D9PVX8_METTM|nr:DUF1616 domain-containing protein [Methanothermobacter marburgensis]ADL58376.1 conserved hypothetical protein [Methanothermobacter marburgensis str. Marburg]